MSNNKQSIKIYTEEQVKEMIDDAHNGVDGYYDILKKHKPIELPSDDEIREERLLQFPDSEYANRANDRLAFYCGARFIINKIQGGNK